jgi:hypothetical protein
MRRGTSESTPPVKPPILWAEEGLYPHSHIRHQPFEESKLADGLDRSGESDLRGIEEIDGSALTCAELLNSQPG